MKKASPNSGGGFTFGGHLDGTLRKSIAFSPAPTNDDFFEETQLPKFEAIKTFQRGAHCIIAIRRLRKLIREPLQHEEQDKLTTCYFSFGHSVGGAIDSFPKIRDLVFSTGEQTTPESELSDFLERVGYVSGSNLSLRQFLEVMMFVKKRFKQNAATSDTLCAFLGLMDGEEGEDSDEEKQEEQQQQQDVLEDSTHPLAVSTTKASDGTVTTRNDISIEALLHVCAQFQLSDEVEMLIRDADEDGGGRIDFEEFEELLVSEEAPTPSPTSRNSYFFGRLGSRASSVLSPRAAASVVLATTSSPRFAGSTRSATFNQNTLGTFTATTSVGVFSPDGPEWTQDDSLGEFNTTQRNTTFSSPSSPALLQGGGRRGLGGGENSLSVGGAGFSSSPFMFTPRNVGGGASATTEVEEKLAAINKVLDATPGDHRGYAKARRERELAARAYLATLAVPRNPTPKHPASYSSLVPFEESEREGAVRQAASCTKKRTPPNQPDDNEDVVGKDNDEEQEEEQHEDGDNNTGNKTERSSTSSDSSDNDDEAVPPETSKTDVFLHRSADGTHPQPSSSECSTPSQAESDTVRQGREKTKEPSPTSSGPPPVGDTRRSSTQSFEGKSTTEEGTNSASATVSSSEQENDLVSPSAGERHGSSSLEEKNTDAAPPADARGNASEDIDWNTPANDDNRTTPPTTSAQMPRPPTAPKTARDSTLSSATSSNRVSRTNSRRPSTSSQSAAPRKKPSSTSSVATTSSSSAASSSLGRTNTPLTPRGQSSAATNSGDVLGRYYGAAAPNTSTTGGGVVSREVKRPWSSSSSVSAFGSSVQRMGMNNHPPRPPTGIAKVAPLREHQRGKPLPDDKRHTSCNEDALLVYHDVTARAMAKNSRDRDGENWLQGSTADKMREDIPEYKLFNPFLGVPPEQMKPQYTKSEKLKGTMAQPLVDAVNSHPAGDVYLPLVAQLTKERELRESRRKSYKIMKDGERRAAEAGAQKKRRKSSKMV